MDQLLLFKNLFKSTIIIHSHSNGYKNLTLRNKTKLLDEQNLT